MVQTPIAYCSKCRSGRIYQTITPLPGPPFPPARLRQALARCRAQHLDFDTAWEQTLPRILAGIPWQNRERENWRVALGGTASAWRAAYDGAGNVIKLNPALLDHEPEADRFPVRSVA